MSSFDLLGDNDRSFELNGPFRACARSASFRALLCCLHTASLICPLNTTVNFMKLVAGGRKLDGQLDLVELIARVKGKDRTIAERLQDRAVKAPNGCILYMGPVDPGSLGYPRISVGKKKPYAHRALYEERHGPVPAGMILRHRCNNPRCINDACHVLGTAADNRADMVSAGRQRRTLNKAEVLQIVEFHRRGRSIEHLAEQFKVSEFSIRQIFLGKRWSKLTGIAHVPKAPFGRHTQLKEAA